MTDNIQYYIDNINSAKTEIRQEINTLAGYSAITTERIDKYADGLHRIYLPKEELEPTLHGVNYYNYKGDLLYVYSVDEFLALSSHPQQDETDTLIGNGWNWDLYEAKNFIQNTFDLLNIGGQYITRDGKTRIYIEIPDSVEGEILPFKLTFSRWNSGSSMMYVDWGDGSNIDSISLTNWTNNGTMVALNYFNHVYQHAGNYIIKIWGDDNLYYTLGYNSGYATVVGYSYTTYRVNALYVKKIECGRNVVLKWGGLLQQFANAEYLSIPAWIVPNSTFENTISQDNQYANAVSNKVIIIPRGCEGFDNVSATQSRGYSFGIQNYSAKAICIPNGFYKNLHGQSMFHQCESVDSIIFPTPLNTGVGARCFTADESLRRYYFSSQQTELPEYYLNTCHNLKEVIIPETVTTVKAYALTALFNVEQIEIPSGVTSFATKNLDNSYTLKTIIFRPTTPPSYNGTFLTTLAYGYKIYVPYSSDHSVLNAYKTAYSWVADKMYELDTNGNIPTE